MTEGEDFVGVNTTIDFLPGQDLREQVSVHISIIGDECVEEEETFKLVLSSYDSDITISSNAMAEVAIVDNDGKHDHDALTNHA